MAQDQSKQASWSDKVLIILFCLFMLLPAMDMAFHLDRTAPRSENRLLATPPEFPRNIGGTGKYLNGWQAYVNDHFGFRRALILWHGRLVSKLFKDSSHDVLVGRGGWLYLSSSRMIDHFTGQLQFSQADLESWRRLLESRRDWLAQQHISFLFVIAPDKQSIYPDYLPEWLKNTGKATKADQFFAYMKTHSTVHVLDLRPALLAARKSAFVYQQTDSHWNELGAFVAYDQLVQALSDTGLPNMDHLSMGMFETTNRLVEGGDLTRMLGITLQESNAVFFTPGPQLPGLAISTATNQSEDACSFLRKPASSGLAIIFHDSFGQYWVPFLGYHFKEVDYYGQSFLNSQVIEQKHPDVVVCEMIERSFDTDNAAKLAAQDNLPMNSQVASEHP